MKTKTKVTLAVTTTIIGGIITVWIQSGEMIKATYGVMKTDAAIAYHLPKLAQAELEVSRYKDTIKRLEALRSDLNQEIENIAYDDHFKGLDEIDGVFQIN